MKKKIFGKAVRPVTIKATEGHDCEHPDRCAFDALREHADSLHVVTVITPVDHSFFLVLFGGQDERPMSARQVLGALQDMASDVPVPGPDYDG